MRHLKFLFIFVLGFLLENLAFAQRERISAVFDPPARKRFYFNAGDYIKVKIKNNDGMYVLGITEVRDSGFVIENQYFTPFSDIEKITLFPQKRLRGLKKTLAFGGFVFPLVSAGNALFNKNIPKDNLLPIAAGALPFGAAYLGLKINDWVGVTYSTKRNPIKPVLYNPYYK